MQSVHSLVLTARGSGVAWAPPLDWGKMAGYSWAFSESSTTPWRLALMSDLSAEAHVLSLTLGLWSTEDLVPIHFLLYLINNHWLSIHHLQYVCHFSSYLSLKPVRQCESFLCLLQLRKCVHRPPVTWLDCISVGAMAPVLPVFYPASCLMDAHPVPPDIKKIHVHGCNLIHPQRPGNNPTDSTGQLRLDCYHHDLHLSFFSSSPSNFYILSLAGIA